LIKGGGFYSSLDYKIKKVLVMKKKTKNKKSISKKTKNKKDSENVIIKEVAKEESKEKYIMVCNVKYGNEIYKIGDEVPQPLKKLFLNKKFCNICEG
jgi:hypothetical protein